jgi:hypothetical protein
MRNKIWLYLFLGLKKTILFQFKLGQGGALSLQKPKKGFENKTIFLLCKKMI